MCNTGRGLGLCLLYAKPCAIACCQSPYLMQVSECIRGPGCEAALVTARVNYCRNFLGWKAG